jgi:hypothetical protein
VGRSARFKLVFVATAVVALATALTAAANVALTIISTDPYKNVGSQHATEVEPDSFSFGSTIVSAVQVGRYYNGGSSNIGWGRSTNGGTTWTHGYLPGLTINSSPPGPYTRASLRSPTTRSTTCGWSTRSPSSGTATSAAPRRS